MPMLSSNRCSIPISWQVLFSLSACCLLLGCSDASNETPKMTSVPPSVEMQVKLAPKTHVVKLSASVQYELQSRLINAVPGDTIQLEEGIYQLNGQLDVSCDNLTIRGRGHDKTILSFRGQQVGSEGLVATGNSLVIQDLAVEDAAGNAIKVLGAEGVIFRGVRTEWTGGPSPDNGAYGIYPVQCSNVLIEDCIAIGASDAGIYVGQSYDVIVRGCRVEQNVAGIEIENTHRADVYDNVATNNTGGLLVFDLPGLPVTNGSKVRVFKNKIFQNNTPNFAPPGNIVATVPAGTGLMIMAMDDVEVFENEISDNQSTGISIVSFLITGRPPKDPDYDPYPEGIWIHHNVFSGGGDKPSGQLMESLAAVLGTPFPQIFYDGIAPPETTGDSPAPLVISDNGEVTFANGNVASLSPESIAAGTYAPDLNADNYLGTRAAIKPVSLKPLSEPRLNGNPAVMIYRQAPSLLSEWGLFEGTGNTQQPIEGVIPYQLNTPLFSDHTSKFRFIRLPTGQAMTYRAQGALAFPVGTIIAKTFAYSDDMQDDNSPLQLLETRIQQHTASGWYGFSYLWNEDQTDAQLVLGGASREVSWVNADGATQSNNYQIPNANQCLVCHSQDGHFVPLGPTAANLNRDFNYPSGHQNQLDHFQQAGLLVDAPQLDFVDSLPVYDDSSTGSIPQRARAWLDVNCAHCHNPKGTARTSGLDLSISQQEPARFGVWKSPVATGRGSGGRKFDIVPGKPAESILLYRLESDEPGVRMPNLSRNLSHPASLSLIEQWIADMPVEEQ